MRTFVKSLSQKLVVVMSVGMITLATARGAVVSYSHDAFDADADIDTNGYKVIAVNLGSNVPITVNGVTFAADVGSLFANAMNWTDTAYYTGGAIGSLSQTNANALLNTTEFGKGANNSLVRLTGLTVGKSYTLQMLFCYASYGTRTISFNYNVTSGGVLGTVYGPLDRSQPTVVTGIFVADESVQDIHVALTPDNNGQLAAYQLRTEDRSSAGRENWQHTMAAGSFGVAFLNNSGDVLLTDGSRPPTVLLSGKNVSRILAADIIGSSGDELVYIADPDRGLYYYNFDTQATSGPHGSFITDITSIYWASTDYKMSVIVATGIGTYRFTAPNVYSASFGELSWVMRGDFTVGDNTDELVGIASNGKMFTYDTEGSTWRNIGGTGTGHRVIVTGNIDTTKLGDEVLLFYSDAKWYVVEVETSLSPLYSSLGGSGAANSGAATGDIDGNGVKGYVCLSSSIDRHGNYPPAVVDAWESGWAEKNTLFVDVLLADLDGNGKDEVYGIKTTDDNMIWKFADGDTAFEALRPFKGTIIVIQ